MEVDTSTCDSRLMAETKLINPILYGSSVIVKSNAAKHIALITLNLIVRSDINMLHKTRDKRWNSVTPDQQTHGRPETVLNELWISSRNFSVEQSERDNFLSELLLVLIYIIIYIQ